MPLLNLMTLTSTWVRSSALRVATIHFGKAGTLCWMNHETLLPRCGHSLREGGDFETASEAVNIRSGADKDSTVELHTVASVYIEPQSGREGRFAAERVGSKPPPDCD